MYKLYIYYATSSTAIQLSIRLLNRESASSIISLVLKIVRKKMFIE